MKHKANTNSVSHNPCCLVSERKVEFDEESMLKLVKKDKMLSFFYKDNFEKSSSEDKSVGLEAMFQMFVLGDVKNGKDYMKVYKSLSEIKKPIEEEWVGYKPNMPVQVVGVKNGKITSNGGGVEIFKNLKDAQKKYSDLDPEENSKRFTWVMRGEIKGRDAGRFETWQAEKMYSMEEQVFRDIMKEAKFNARILPANLEDLEMKTLIVAIGSTVIGLLDKIKKNTGSNANPVSLQVIKGGDAIKNALKSNLDLKGKEALVAFFKETNKHFGADAPVISSIVRKYKLKSDKYSGKVFAEQETKLRELVRGYLKNKLNMNEAKKSKMIPMEKYGAAYMIDNGTLMSVAMLRDGSFETWDGDLDWGEVTAPQDQKFLDDINKKFKTKFKMDDFVGR